MKKNRDTCPRCGESLDSPLARSRGEHVSCIEKSDDADGDGEYIEK